MKSKRYQRNVLLLCLLGIVAAPRGVESFLALPPVDVVSTPLPQRVNHDTSAVSGRPSLSSRPLLVVLYASQKTSSVEQEIAELERQVLASAREKMDYNQITRALIGDDDKIVADDAASSHATTPTWQIALTASTVTAGISFLLFSNLYVALFVWVSIFLAANTDPVQDDSGSLVGPLARVVGRATLQSYQTSKPTLQALARAVVTGQDQVRTLELEKESLRAQKDELELWKRRRLWVEDNLQKYGVQELKQRARENQLPVGGTKMQLLQRLVDAQVMDIDE